MGNCIGGIMSHVIYFSEKFSMFLSFSALISCSIICMVCMLAFGIGLGYNYSYVDFKTKHIYVGEHYKKVRPKGYSGIGHYIPTTMDPKYTTKTRKKKTTKRWYGQRAQTQSEGQDPEVFEIVHEFPEDAPHQPPDAMIPNNDVVLDNGWDSQARVVHHRTKLENLYFSTPTPGKRRISTSLSPQSESTTEIPLYYVENNTRVEATVKELQDKASNNSDFSATKLLRESEPITVNVTKTRDTAPPLVLKTMMHQNQLMKWLSRLQDANKTFAVHVITN